MGSLLALYAGTMGICCRRILFLCASLGPLRLQERPLPPELALAASLLWLKTLRFDMLGMILPDAAYYD
jgi:hypothetical protein